MSIYSNGKSLDATTGEILFGGVDTAKFKGNLITLPIDKREGETHAREFAITLTALTLINENGMEMTITDDSFAVATLLDTGSTYTYLPTDIVASLTHEVGAQSVESLGVSIIPCEARSYNGTVLYGFSGANISVSLRELIVDAFDNQGNPAMFTDGTPLCYFGILDAADGSNVLVRIAVAAHIQYFTDCFDRGIPFFGLPTLFMIWITKKSVLQTHCSMSRKARFSRLGQGRIRFRTQRVPSAQLR